MTEATQAHFWPVLLGERKSFLSCFRTLITNISLCVRSYVMILYSLDVFSASKQWHHEDLWHSGTKVSLAVLKKCTRSARPFVWPP